MEGWNHEIVKELADQYETCGLGQTSSGRFLRSLATEGKPPRGGGIKWLNDLLGLGDPSERVRRAQEVEELFEIAGTQRPRLERMSIKLKSGQQLADWEEKILSEIRDRKDVSLVEPTPLQKVLLEAAYHRARSQSPYYWAQRQGTFNRLRSLFEQSSAGVRLPISDYEWLEKTFNSLHRELKTDIDLIGELRFYYDPKASATFPIVVTGPALYDYERYLPAVPCLINGEIRNIPIRMLAKRRPKV
jgi:hypothetical protein